MAKLYLICFVTVTVFVLGGQSQTKGFKNVMKYVESMRNSNGGRRLGMSQLESMMKGSATPGSGSNFGGFGGMGRGMGRLFRNFGASSRAFMDGGFGPDFTDGFGDMASGGMDMASGGMDMASGGMDMVSGGMDMVSGF